jgi:hypothetical protein
MSARLGNWAGEQMRLASLGGLRGVALGSKPAVIQIRKSVDTFSVINGTVVATGWCDGPDPVIALDGTPIQAQLCRRFHREDVVAVFGDKLRNSAFHSVAIAPDVADNTRLSVRFSDNECVRRTAPDRSDAQNILGSFASRVNTNGGSMLEIGSRARSGTTYKDMFTGLTSYVGADVAAGPNVDVVVDAHTMSKAFNQQFDYVFSISVFEHLIMPWVVACEINKLLKPGGYVFTQSHPAYPLHEEPWDFFRFSKNAWVGLFNPMTGFEVVETGYGIEAAIVPAAANDGPLQGMDKSPTYLLSACLARKVSESIVNWSADPSTIYDLNYTH